jgi:hypothetical protein
MAKEYLNWLSDECDDDNFFNVFEIPKHFYYHAMIERIAFYIIYSANLILGKDYIAKVKEINTINS